MMTPASLPFDRLQSRLASLQDEMAEMLTALIRAESPSHDPVAQEPVQALLRAALQDRGLRVRKVRGRRTGGLLLASPCRRTRGGPRQLLLGHCDTVWPLGTLREMPVRQEQGKLFGPGGYDMKAGLVQAIFALQVVRELGLGGEVSPVVLINSDEEIGSPESARWIRELAKASDRVFVMEPSLGAEGALKTARKGVGRFVIRVRGRASHAGLAPGEGASAIHELSHVVQALFAMNDAARGVTVNVGSIDGGLRPNVVAPEARAEVDVRVVTREDAAAVEAAIHGLQPHVPGTRLEIEGRFGRPPMEHSPGNRLLWERACDAADALGIPLREAMAGGGSDGNITSQFTPTLDGLGAVGDGAHAATEYVWVERMPERAALLASLLAMPRLPAATSARVAAEV